MSMIADNISHGLISNLTGGALDKIGMASTRALNMKYPLELPGIEQLLWAFRTGTLPQHETELLCKMQGANFAWGAQRPDMSKATWDQFYRYTWSKVYDSETPYPQTGELLALLNRQRIDPGFAHVALQRHGFDDPAIRDLILSLKDELPGSADLVRFSIRHVFEPDLLLRFGFLEEERPEFEFWHGQQGLGYNWLQEPYYSQYEKWLKDNGYGQQYSLSNWKNLGIDRMSWARAFWASHWVWLSPQQGYAALQRLRPSGGPHGKARDPAGNVFTEDDLRLLLRGNDYPPKFREILRAISYRKLGVRQLAQEFKAGLIAFDELVESYQDIGYDKDDATRFARITASQAKVPVRKANIAVVRKSIIEGYRLGIITRDDATRNLYYAGLNTQDKIDEYLKAPPRQQLTLASADTEVSATLDALDFERSIDHARRVLKSTQRNFVKGRYNRLQARGHLLDAGILSDTADQLLDDWTLDIQDTGKELGANSVIKGYRYGIINQQQAVLRLHNLGFSPDAITVMVGLAQRDIGMDVARALAKSAQDAKAQRAAQAAVVRQARAVVSAEQRTLARQGSPGQLGQWLMRGLITEQQMRQRLANLGYNDPQLSKLVELAILKRQDYIAKACAKKKGPYPAGITCPPGTDGATQQANEAQAANSK